MPRPVDPDAVAPRVAAAPALAAVLFLLAFVTYHNSFSGAFVLDDAGSIVENASIRQLWSPTKVLSPPQQAGTGGRPLANFTFALNYAVSELDPWSYHAVNVALHGLTAALLFGVTRRTLQRSSPTLAGVATGIAFATAALWVVHPLPSAAVDYLSQRTECLMALLYLATLYAVIRSAERPEQRRWPAMAIGACALGMAAKETMATVPLLVLLHDRAFLAGSFRGALRQRTGLYAGLALGWVLLGALVAGSSLGERGVGLGLAVGPLDYARAQAVALIRYLALAIWPYPLVFDYGWAYPRNAFQAVPPAIAVLGLLATAGWTAWRWPRAGFLGAAFFVLLAPTSTFIPIIQQPIAESRMYLPSAVVIAGAVLAAVRLLGPRRGTVVALALLVPLLALTVHRNLSYATPERLWTDTLAKRPDNARAHASLGADLLARGDIAAAVRHLQRALELHPAYPEAQNNLGVALLRSNRAPDAAAHFEAALAAHPGFADAHYNYAEACHVLGRTDEAIRHLETALQLSPEHARAWNNLSVLRLDRGQVSAAIAAAQSALRLQPGLADAH